MNVLVRAEVFPAFAGGTGPMEAEERVGTLVQAARATAGGGAQGAWGVPANTTGALLVARCVCVCAC